MNESIQSGPTCFIQLIVACAAKLVNLGILYDQNGNNHINGLTKWCLYCRGTAQHMPPREQRYLWAHVLGNMLFILYLNCARRSRQHFTRPKSKSFLFNYLTYLSLQLRLINVRKKCVPHCGAAAARDTRANVPN